MSGFNNIVTNPPINPPTNPPTNPPNRWKSLVDDVRNDHVHGASWLARRAADILAGCASESLTRIGPALHSRYSNLDELAMLAWALAWARPSMAAIANTVAAIWLRSVNSVNNVAVSDESGEIAASIGRLRDEAQRQRDGWASISSELERMIIPFLREPVCTLSRSGSVERALSAVARMRSSDTPLNVIIMESRPGQEGIALAQSLTESGARVSLVPDSAVGVAMAQARMLLLGADSVRRDGALINKVGSYPAALVATDLSIPVYALCERLKITPPSYPLSLERAEDHSNARWIEENWLFDETPARLITSVISEVGALSQDQIAQLAADAENAFVALKNSAERATANLNGVDHQA